MFDKNSYEILRKSKEFKKFSRNCYLGFSVLFIVFALMIFSCFMLVYKACYADCNYAKCALIYGASILFGLAAVNVAVYLGLNKRTPSVCTYGVIKSIEKKYAIVEVGGKKLRATSFDNFLRNKGLDGYKEGDRVLIYSSSPKNGRPLFL